MVIDLKKILFITLLGFLSSCRPSQESHLISLLRNNYSNLYTKEEASKRKSITELEQYLAMHQLNDKSIENVKLLLNKINDGHVVIKDARADKNIIYKSGLKFIKGSSVIESCLSCTPSLSHGKYEVIAVDGKDIKSFKSLYQKHIAASSDWGREYKVMRLLEASRLTDIKKITLKDSHLKEIEISLNWEITNTDKRKCIDVDSNTKGIARVIIHTLWCNYGDNSLSRNEILNNFKKELELAFKNISPSEAIILDLRENGGGGDEEVEYVLNSFFKESVQMYKYKYLKTTQESQEKRIFDLINNSDSIWSNIEFQMTNPKHKVEFSFLENKLVVLTSPGCFSSCEGLASILKFNKRAKIIGARTHGGAGAPLDYSLKGTPYILGLPASLTWQNNGELYEGEGVIPDLVLEQSLNELKDTVLAKAVDLIL